MRENMNKDLKYFNPMKLREKYSVKPVGSNYSSFWLNNDWDTTSSWDEDDKPKGPDLIQLASYRRAIKLIGRRLSLPSTIYSYSSSYVNYGGMRLNPL